MYFNLIIIPLEKEIKKRKRNINKRFSLTKQIEKTYLEKLETLLNHYYQEFTILVKEYYDYPKEVICPVLILQGNKDNIVPISSSEYVYESLNKNTKKLVIIDGVTHDIFRTNKKEEIFKIVEDFLKYNTKGGIDKI